MKGTITKKLTLDFMSPTDTERLAPQTLRLRDLIQSRASYHEPEAGPGIETEVGLSGLLMQPEWYADYAYSQIGWYLRMRHPNGERGDMLHRRVGATDIRVGGKLQNTINPAAVLKDMRFHDSPRLPFMVYDNDPFMTYLEWKMRVLEARKAAGLPVVYPDKPDLYKKLRWRPFLTAVKGLRVDSDPHMILLLIMVWNVFETSLGGFCVRKRSFSGVLLER